ETPPPPTPTTTPATTAGATTTTAAASQACADAAALKASVAELDQIDPPDAGKAVIQPAREKVRTNLAALRTSAASQWGTEVGELDSAVNALQTTVSGIAGNSLLSALPTIVNNLEQIDGAWNALERRIDQDCG